jgi:hypothetical protein
MRPWQAASISSGTSVLAAGLENPGMALMGAIVEQSTHLV